MDVFKTISELRNVLDAARARGQRIGMVGTSGAVHAGHLSLVRRAASDNDIMAMYWGGSKASFDWQTSSISYDRDADRDFALIESAGCHLIFAPNGHDFFPRQPMTKIGLPAMSSEVPHLEDPAHLDLISLAISKLWNIFGPCRNYFGEKDWQQYVMFKRLADDLNFPVEVIGCPTIREEDGLAVSSRNSQLTAEERATAPILYQALLECREAALGGVRDTAELEKLFAETVGESASIRYFTAVGGETMSPLEELAGSVRMLASIQLGAVRLLDNVGVEVPS